MTVRIELAHEKERILKAKAEAAGMSVDDYAARILDRDLTVEAVEETASQKPDEAPIPGSVGAVAKMILDRVRKLPPEAFDGLPTDGASQHDHYIYGTPKREDL